MRNVTDKICRENQNTDLCSIILPKSMPLMKNVVQSDRPSNFIIGCIYFYAGYLRQE